MGNGFTEVECQVEGLLVLFAGTESTACAIRSAILHVITAPSVYARLKEEIRSAIADGKVVSRPISMQEAVALPYLQVRAYTTHPTVVFHWLTDVNRPLCMKASVCDHHFLAFGQR